MKQSSKQAASWTSCAYIFQEIFTEAIRLSGTITGEHGIGVAKKKHLPAQAGPTQMRVLRELRKVLGPNGIPNPGKAYRTGQPFPQKRARR